MRKAQRGLKHAHEGAARAALDLDVRILRLALRDLDVPVAVLVPYEAIDRGGGAVEAIVGERLLDLRFGALLPADDPAVDEGELRGLREILALHIHQDEARRV